MDGGRFDDFIRVIGQPIDRRQGLRGLVAAAVAGLTGHLVLPGATAQRRRAEKRRLSTDGPCGDGSPRHNTCRHDRQCCTGYCNRKTKRCRCRRRGQSCTEDRNCCRRGGQSLTCQDQTCRPAPVCGPESCPVCQRCDDATGQCVADSDQNETCCSGPTGGKWCLDGQCVAVSNRCQAPPSCTPGSCPVCQRCDSVTGQCVIDQGQERACCNGPTGGQWCRSGRCVAVPSSGTNDDCQGVCNGEVPVPICGVTMNCPTCGDCPCGASGCSINGAFGLQVYCVRPSGQGCGSCSSGSQCCGSTQQCVTVCV